MAEDQAKMLLRQGIAAAKEGRSAAARDLLRQAVRANPRDETAWLWLSSVAPNDRERVFCLKQVLAINPQNEFALKGLAALGYAPPAQEAAPATSVPVLAEDKYLRILPALDDLLLDYPYEPEADGGQAWVHKPRRRYGEAAARRLQQATVAAAALVLVALVAGGALLADSLGLFDGESDSAAVVYQPVFTLTPTATMTATPGFWPTPTPFPARLSVGATTVPVGLEPAGSIYGLATPTPIYPEFDSSVQRRIEPAIDLYSIGRYAEAQRELATAQASYSGQCYPALVYYHAMAYAAQGGTANLNAAARLLQDGLAYTPPGDRYRGEAYDSCPDAPLLHAGLAEVWLRQGRTAQAYSASQQALEADPRLVPASLVKAEIEQSRGNFGAAEQTLLDALALSPRDTNLLVRLGELSLAQGRANAALEYAGKALYVDPLLLPALRLQTRAYLALAEGAPENRATAREEYFGLAAHSAQTLLLYYPGDPQGHLLLAEARLGEGNAEQAEEALNRLLAVEDAAFREQHADILRQAYQRRGELYLRQGRIALANQDLRRAGPTGAIDRLLALDLVQGDYDDAALQLTTLLNAPGANSSAYQLVGAQLAVEACRYSALDDLECDDARALELLTDEFIGVLPGEQQAEAYSLRGQARYWLTQARGLPSAAGRVAYQAALDDLNRARSQRDHAVDHYFRGLVLAELGALDEALSELMWVKYWDGLYDYPFVPDDFDQQVMAVEERAIAAREAALATATATVRSPSRESQTDEPDEGSPTPAAPTPTPVPTIPFEERPQLP